MKYRIAVLSLAAGVIALMSSTSHAFQSVAKSTFVAGVLTGGSKVADVSVVLRDVTDPFGADQPVIAWSGVTPPNTGLEDR